MVIHYNYGHGATTWRFVAEHEHVHTQLSNKQPGQSAFLEAAP